jgi:hypothetical protein
MAAKTKPPTGCRPGAAPKHDHAERLIFPESTDPTFRRQVHRLAFRFFLPASTAAVVAEHAFSKGGGR